MALEGKNNHANIENNCHGKERQKKDKEMSNPN
jgi:hypothetical protein